MWMISKKEWQQFFGSIMGYLVLGIFLAIAGLLFFVFPDTSLLNFGYANLDGFFRIMPWLLLFFIPAITMRSIAEELNTGSFEVLKTLPLKLWQIIIGKYLGILMIISVSLIPTIIYAFSMQALSITGGIDIGAMIGSYISLFLLAGVYGAIGILASSLTRNGIAAFAIGVFFCFILFVGFEALSQLPFGNAGWDYYIQLFGIKEHTANMSRGVIDFKDMVYFFAVMAFFLYLTYLQLIKLSSNK
jgi:ABC-2 type transport system permease protein